MTSKHTNKPKKLHKSTNSSNNNKNNALTFISLSRLLFKKLYVPYLIGIQWVANKKLYHFVGRKQTHSEIAEIQWNFGCVTFLRSHAHISSAPQHFTNINFLDETNCIFSLHQFFFLSYAIAICVCVSNRKRKQFYTATAEIRNSWLKSWCVFVLNFLIYSIFFSVRHKNSTAQKNKQLISHSKLTNEPE